METNEDKLFGTNKDWLRSDGTRYNPDYDYIFTDKDGNTFKANGRNGYVWQAVTNGVPISVNDKGEWFIEPYIEVTSNGLNVWMPEWFKNSPEYNEWMNSYSHYLQPGINADTFNQLNDILKGYGSQGVSREALKNRARAMGVTDEELATKYAQDYISLINEGAGYGKASIGLYDQEGMSATDIAREFKNMNKEQLSEAMSGIRKMIEYGSQSYFEGTTDQQKTVLNALLMNDILRYINDNPSKFGEEKEFDGLLDASLQQKMVSFMESGYAQLLNGLAAYPARITHARMSLLFSKDHKYDGSLTQYVDYTTDKFAGAELEGREGFIKVGGAIGTVENVLSSIAIGMAMGGWVNGLTSGAAATGGFMGTTLGALTAEYFLHDVPVDLMNAFTYLSENDWDFGKAWFDTSRQQNLIAIPIIGEIGPKVPAGLMYDLIGDAIVDLALPVAHALNRSITAQIDDITNGAATRVKEFVAVENLKLQEKFTEIPVIGTGWKKMMTAFMGPENYAIIKNARKASIAEGSMDWYKIANNFLTLKNHGGAEDVIRLYEGILNKMGVVDSVQAFKQLSQNYGGIGKTQVTYKTVEGGAEKIVTKTVEDVLPIQVKQGLLDIERLAELQGQKVKDGGLIFDPERDKEIARLEKKVESLPDDIKDFANRFSQANKMLEQIGVKLGITNEDWYNAMQIDPEFEKYMVRQALVPGGSKSGPAESPAILNKGRKGYYADNYIDPVLAFQIKASALGRAHAWNQQAKLVASMAKASDGISVGVSGMDAAAKMVEVKNQLAGADAVRKAVDYDGVLQKMSTDSATIVSSINEINQLLHAPEQISLKSIYSSTAPQEVQEVINNFDGGMYKFADGVREAAGLTEADAAFMIHNTYSVKTSSGNTKISAQDNVDVETVKGGAYNAGVASDGTAYRYTIKDGVISDIKVIDDPKGMAETIQRLGGVYNIDTYTVSKMGAENARGINRAILFYRDNMPNLPQNNRTFRVMPLRDGAGGRIPNFTDPDYGFKFVDGKIVTTSSPIDLASAFFTKGKEAQNIEVGKAAAADFWHPRNSGTLERTPVHENAHATMLQIAMARVNEKISSGKLYVPEYEYNNSSALGIRLDMEWDDLNFDLATRALERVGENIKNLSKDEIHAVWQDLSSNTISHYAGFQSVYRWETYSEAMVDVYHNKDNASKFSKAIVEEMKIECQKYAMSISPRKILAENDLDIKAKMFKGDEYNFPSSAKTRSQKAAWLNKQRQDNPYLKGGDFTTEQYQKANKWDTFFKKEIETYDASYKTTSPSRLIDKNGKFLEDLSATSAKQLVEKIQNASIYGFDENLAMIALGGNKVDSAEALDNFIIGRVNEGARRIASKMDGGETEANLNRARITLWQDDTVKSDASNLLSSLAPDLSQTDIQAKIDSLFGSQAAGLAAVDSLPVSYKGLSEEYTKLANELELSNKAARAAGKKKDAQLKSEGYINDATQTIHYREGGEDVYVVVKDPIVASIMKRPDDFKTNGVTAESISYAANTIARLYRLGTTGVNPVAFVRNILRDPLQATFTAGFNPLTANLDPQYFYKTLRQYGLDDTTIKTVQERLYDWSSRGTLTAELKQSSGIPSLSEVSYTNNVEKFERWFNKAMSDEGTALGKIINIAESPLETWESFFRNQVAQQSFTKAMQRTRGDVDKSLASAMFDASNATTNFSHSVYFARRFTSSVPYFASAINGTASFWRLFNIDPIGMIGRISAGIIVPTLAITAWNLGSEERRKSYMNLPEWYRDTHFVLVDLEGNILSLPIPDEVSQFSSVSRRMIEYTQEANEYSIPSILAQGAFGFLPVDVDGYFGEDGTFQLEYGTKQLLSSLLPQGMSVLYEAATETSLYTGTDISDYDTFNKVIYNLGNVFGSSFTNIVNDLAFIIGQGDKVRVGRTTLETLSRDLFGLGFDESTRQFMSLVGSPSVSKNKATGLFKESEDLKLQLEKIDREIAFANDEDAVALSNKRQELIEEFGQRVANLTNKYMQLYSVTGGLEDWQRKKLIQILGMGGAVSSAAPGSYQEESASQAQMDEYALGRQRYVDLGLPSGPTVESLATNNSGNLVKSYELQAAIDRFYGAPKQATQDYKNALEATGLKDIRNEFYGVISEIYDKADELGISPDYDMIEKIQARYLQAVDAVLMPIINQYGTSILNNNDFIDAVQRQVNGMIPSDDWRQSARNAKKFLSTKDFPTATVDVKKWLQQRYSSGMRDRGLSSDQEVTDRLEEIRQAIDAGQMGAAKSKIDSLTKGIDKANFYISSQDYQKLIEYKNMLK